MAFLRDLLTRIRVRVQAGGVRQLNTHFESAKAGARGFDKGLNDVTQSAKNMQDVLAGRGGGLLQSLSVMRRSLNLGAFAAAIGGGALAGYVNQVRNTIDAVGKQSDQLGISTDSFQVLERFASHAGLAQQDVVTAFRAMSKQAEQFARTGKGEAEPAFRRLGLTMADVAKLSADPEALFFRLGGAMGDLANYTERSAVAQRLFGESGAKLIPGFKAGTEGASEQRRALRELAIVYDQGLVRAVEEMNDEFGDQVHQFRRVGAEVIRQLIPAFKVLGDLVGSLSKWTAKNIKETDLYSGALIVLATAFGTAALRAVAFKEGMFSLAGVRAVMQGLSAGFNGAFVAGLKLAAIAAVIAGALLIVDDVIGSIQGKDGIFRRLLNEFLGAEEANEVLAKMASNLNELALALKFVTQQLLILFGIGDRGRAFWQDIRSLLSGDLVTKFDNMSESEKANSPFARGLGLLTNPAPPLNIAGAGGANRDVQLRDLRQITVNVSTPDAASATGPLMSEMETLMSEDRRHMLENLSSSGAGVQ